MLHSTSQFASPDSWTALQTHLPVEQALWLVLGIALMRDWCGARRTPRRIDRASVASATIANTKARSPQVRMACLMGGRYRLLVDAAFDAYITSEYALAERLRPQLPEESLVLVDKGFYSAALLWPFHQHAGRHWLIPARANARGEVIETYGKGDYLLRVKVSPQARKRQPVATWEVRAITCLCLMGRSVPCLPHWQSNIAGRPMRCLPYIASVGRFNWPTLR